MLWRRPSPAFLLVLRKVAAVGAIAAGAAACESIGLSADDAVVPGAYAGGQAKDAAVDASPPVTGTTDGANLSEPPSEGGTASTIVGNPLCYFDLGAGGAHNCEPDTSSQCATSDDAGAFTGWDAGVASPSGSDAGDAGDAGPPASACHVCQPDISSPDCEVPHAQACVAAGPGGDGAQCQVSGDCAASFECVGSPGECRHYCCGGNTSCDKAANVTTGATFCDVQPTVSGAVPVPVCEPVVSCTLLLTGTGNGSCPKGETCAVVKDDGTTSCVTIGTVGIGGDCDIYHCAAELTCLGSQGSRKCYQLCEVNSPASCPSGTTCTSSAQLFTNANVGICQ